jgi:hypothetical protein
LSQASVMRASAGLSSTAVTPSAATPRPVSCRTLRRVTNELNLSAAGTVKFTMLIHCFNSLKGRTAALGHLSLSVARTRDNASDADCSDGAIWRSRPEQFAPSDGAINSSEDQRTALSSERVVGEIWKGC